jgi:hypothetical protein
MFREGMRVSYRGRYGTIVSMFSSDDGAWILYDDTEFIDGLYFDSRLLPI